MIYSFYSQLHVEFKNKKYTWCYNENNKVIGCEELDIQNIYFLIQNHSVSMNESIIITPINFYFVVIQYINSKFGLLFN